MSNAPVEWTEIARGLLEMLEIRLEDPNEQERFEKRIGQTLVRKFGNPIFPKSGESLV